MAASLLSLLPFVEAIHYLRRCYPIWLPASTRAMQGEMVEACNETRLLASQALMGGYMPSTLMYLTVVAAGQAALDPLRSLYLSPSFLPFFGQACM